VRTQRTRTHTELLTTSPDAPTFVQRGLQNKLPEHAVQAPPDVRFLLRYLNIEQYDAAVAVITRYYPLQRFPQKALNGLEEILSGG
jgi:hypothetical protein